DNTIENGSAALQNWMADAIDANCDVALVELDESNIHSDSLIGGIDMLVIAPGSSNTDAVESFGPDKIHAGLDAMHPEGVAVVCGDCVKTHRQVLNSGRRLLSYGMRKRSDVSAKIFDQQPGITTLVVHAGDTSAMMETQLTGGQMAVCQLAAISVGLLLEQTLPDAIQQVSRLQQVPGRLQCLRSEYGKARVVLDAAADGNSLSGVLRDMRREKGTGRLWCVAGLGTTDGNTLARIGNALERFADNVVLTTGDIPSASFLAASHGVMDGVKECALMRLVADRETAIRWVLDHAGKNDTVLILGGIGGQTPAQRRAKINATQSIFAEQSSRQPQPIY
ncbi:MAG: cyanophycin synthetase, partial [Planctomycetota bacterium]